MTPDVLEFYGRQLAERVADNSMVSEAEFADRALELFHLACKLMIRVPELLEECLILMKLEQQRRPLRSFGGNQRVELGNLRVLLRLLRGW